MEEEEEEEEEKAVVEVGGDSWVPNTSPKPIQLMRTYVRKRFRKQSVQLMKTYARKRFHKKSIHDCTLENASHGLLLLPMPSSSEMSRIREDQSVWENDGEETIACNEFTPIANANANGGNIIFDLNKEQISEISSISSAAAIADAAPAELGKYVGGQGEAILDGTYDHEANAANVVPAELTENVFGGKEAILEGTHDHEANVANVVPAEMQKNVGGGGEVILEKTRDHEANGSGLFSNAINAALVELTKNVVLELTHDHDANGSGLFFNFISGDFSSSELPTLLPPSTPILSPNATSSPGHEQSQEKEKQDFNVVSFRGNKENEYCTDQNHISLGNLPSTPSKTNSKKRKEDSIDKNKRPQKKPRKNIYRPKVIGEGKPKRTSQPKMPKCPTSKRASIEPQTPNPATPKRVSSKKTMSRKRGNASNHKNLVATVSEVVSVEITNPTVSCRRSLNFDVENNSEEQQENSPLEEAKSGLSISKIEDGTEVGKANTSQTDCQNDLMQVTQRIDRSSGCLDVSLKMTLNFPTFFKRKKIMRRIQKKNLVVSNTNKGVHPPTITNTRAVIDELPLVVKTKKKRSEGRIPRKDLARSAKIALCKESQIISFGETPVLESPESKSCWTPEMEKNTLSAGGYEGMITEGKRDFGLSIIKLELNNNKSDEGMLTHENIQLDNELRGGMKRSRVEMEPNFIELNHRVGMSERSLLEHEDSMMTTQSREPGKDGVNSISLMSTYSNSCHVRTFAQNWQGIIDLGKEGANRISLISVCPNSCHAQNFAQNGQDMLGPYPGLLGQDQNADVPQNERRIFQCRKLPDKVQKEKMDVSHTENGLLVPAQQGQLSVTKKTKKQAVLEYYSENIKAWRLQLKSITSADKETVDEETKERLESERNLFHGRIQAFTACMHVIQGDRRFSPWKGSVVDSVVGVFLTQNVSDNLSSSTFMSLAAKFPAQISKHDELQDSIGNNTECTSPVNHIVSPQQSPQQFSRKAIIKDTSDIEDAASKIQETTFGSPRSSQSKSYLVSDCNLEEDKPKGSVDNILEKKVWEDKNSKSKEQKPSEIEKTTRKHKKKEEKTKANEIDWDELRRTWQRNGERNNEHKDSVDWEAVSHADASEIADTIKARGQHNIMADRIKEFLDRVVKLHENIDLEWLRHAPPDKVKEYLLDYNGLGLKSVECIRLLGLQQVAFPVDTNVGRIAIRLGWVPLEPLPEELHIHLLQQYPIMDSIQKYLWRLLCTLTAKALYELHYQLITFGKVYCTKRNPNCNSCPMRAECRHYASAHASARRALPGPANKGKASSTASLVAVNNPGPGIKEVSSTFLETRPSLESGYVTKNCEPIIEEPASPEPVCTELSRDIEDFVVEDDPDEMPTIRLGGREFETNLERLCVEMKDMALQDNEESRALVALAPQVATWPVPKLKQVSRLRTKHLVYEIPDSHHLLDELDRRDPDDPCPYLLAIWTPGETESSFQPSEKLCSSQECGTPCNEETCSARNILREQNTNTVRGTILIPCRTAMRGSFPLNGTYFQLNEVFADHKTSEHPIDVPREWLWKLPRRIAYFGTSTTSIFRGLSTDEIQNCFWKGFICIRAFDRETRTPRRLAQRLHISTVQAGKARMKTMEDE